MHQPMTPTRRKFLATTMAAGVAVVALGIGYWLAKPEERTAKLFFDCATLVGVIVGTTVAYTQLALLVDQRREEHAKNRRDGAMWYTINEHDAVRRATRAIEAKWDVGKYNREYPVPIDEVRADPDHQDHLERVLAHWERLALTLFAETSDQWMAFESFGQHVVSLVERFSLFIYDVGAGENPRAYRYLKALYPVWKRQLQEEAGQQAYYVRHPHAWDTDADQSNRMQQE